MTKRFFDIAFSFLGIALALPIITVAWIIASVETRSNGLFVQRRVGLYGKTFNIYKIKTMRDDSSFRTYVTASSDPRITRSGKLFRKCKIDELPQFFNVIRGDMSVVGPRPEVLEYAESLSGEDRVILSVRPGITGPATIKYKNEETTLAKQTDPEEYNRDVIWPDKIRINRKYVEDWSLSLDVRIILKTIVE